MAFLDTTGLQQVWNIIKNRVNNLENNLTDQLNSYLPLGGGTLTGQFTIKNDSQTPLIKVIPKMATDGNGVFIYEDAGSTSGFTNNTLRIRIYSPTSSGATTTNSYYERYSFPDCDIGRTTNSSYNILTTKSAVTIAQGGTGATTAAAARTNLDVPSRSGEGAGGTWQINIGGTATSISSATPTLSTGIEHSAITVKTNENGSLGGNLLAIRSALDFKWYDTNWQVGNLRSDGTNSVGFGFSYSNDGGSTYTLKSYVDINGTLVSNAAKLGGHVTLQYDITNECLNFVFS